MLFRIPGFTSLKSGCGQQNVSRYLCNEPPVSENSYLVRNNFLNRVSEICVFSDSGAKGLRDEKLVSLDFCELLNHHVACFHHL